MGLVFLMSWGLVKPQSGLAFATLLVHAVEETQSQLP